MASMTSHADERQIMNREQFIKEVCPCSHIAEKRPLGYCHHYLVKEVRENGVHIIHYAPVYKLFVRVHETFLPFDKMDFKLGVYLIWSNGYPESEEEKEKAICRALSRCGEDTYMVAINNCEHFVTWALTGRSVSRQINYAKASKKLCIDCFDACFDKTTPFNLIEGIGQVPLNAFFKRGTVPKQLENQALVQPKTPTSPAKVTFDLPATKLTVTTTITTPAENIGTFDLPRNIINSSKKMFSEIPDICMLDQTFRRVIGNVQEKLAEDGLRKWAVDKASVFMPETIPITGNMAPKLGKKFVDESIQSIQKLVSDTTRKYMIDLNAVQTAAETAQKAIVEKAGKEAVKRAGAKSIQAVEIIAGKSAAAVEKVAIEKVGEKSIQAVGNKAVETAGKSAAAVEKVAIEKVGEKSIQSVGNKAVETAGKSAAAVGKETIKQTAKQAAKYAAIGTTVIETIGVGCDIYKLNKAHNNKEISGTDLARGVCTKIIGAVGSIAGSTAGAYLGSTIGAAVGQILIPMPGVGACLGSMIFGAAGKALFSGISGFLFDRLMK